MISSAVDLIQYSADESRGWVEQRVAGVVKLELSTTLLVNHPAKLQGVGFPDSWNLLSSLLI